jgi:hypothetical protein
LLANGQHRRIFNRDEAVQRVNRRQSRVACRGGVAALLLEVFEKREDRVAPQIVYREFHDRAGAASCGKLQQAADCIPISMHRVRTHIPGSDQMPAKEGLDEVREGQTARGPHERSPAVPGSAGA